MKNLPESGRQWDGKVSRRRIGFVLAVSLFSMTPAIAADTRQITAVVSLQVSDERWLLIAFDGAGWRFYGWRDNRGGEIGDACLSRCDRERYFDSPGAACEHFREDGSALQQGSTARGRLRLAC